MAFWTWWQGALWLAGVALTHWLLSGHLMGTSGGVAKVLRWRETEANDAEHAAAQNQAALFEYQMLEATAAQYRELGEPLPPDLEEALAAGPPGAEAEGTPVDSALRCGHDHRLPVKAHFLFLGSLVLGAALARGGTPAPGPGLGPAHTAFFGAGAGALAACLLGGVLVGFGTQAAGGCTSGHGLNGCARGQPGSLAATAAFFGTAIAASLALGKWAA